MQSRLKSDGLYRTAWICMFFSVLMTGLLSIPFQYLKNSAQLISVGQWIPDGAQQNELAEARKQTFDPIASSAINKGNFNSEAWMKLVYRAQEQPLTVVVGPPALREIDVFAPDDSAPSGWRQVQGGSQVPFSKREQKSLNFSVMLQNEKTLAEEQTVYVRIRSNSSNVWVLLLSNETALQLDSALNLTMGLYTGLTLLMILFCLTAWISTGDSTWLLTVLHDTAFLAYSALLSGVLARYVLPDQADHWPLMWAISLTVLCATMGLFYRRIHAYFNIPLSIRQAYLAGMVYVPFSVVAILNGRLEWSLSGVTLVFTWYNLLGMICVVTGRHNNKAIIWLYRSLILLVTTVSTAYLLATLSKTDTSLMLVGLSLPQNNFLTMMLMLMILGLQSWNASQERIGLERAQHDMQTRLALEQEKLSESNSFMSMIIHEVKNPLNYIRLATNNLLYEHAEHSETGLRLRRIKQSVNAIDSVLERSLQVDTLQHGLLHMEPQHMEIVGLIEDFTNLFEEGKRLHLTSPQQLWAEVDGNLLLMMLRNLVDNALKYSAPDSPIHLELDNKPEGLCIEVRNTPGEAGLPDPQHLFEKYYRSSLALQTPGTGLGLYWVRQVALKMGGDVSYRFEHDQVVFELCLMQVHAHA